MFLPVSWARRCVYEPAWRPSVAHVREIWRIGWPAGAMFGNELTCWWVFMSGLVAHFGTAHNTAGWITMRYMHVGFMPVLGLSIAVTAVVGRQIGRGRRDLVAPRTWLAVRLAMVFMGACALAFIIFREPMIRFFAPPAASPENLEVIRIGAQLLILEATFQLFDALALTLSGALRGAGEIVATMGVERHGGRHESADGTVLEHSAWYDSWEPDTQTLEFTIRIVARRDGWPAAETRRHHRVHLFRPEELQELIAAAGMEQVSVAGDFAGAPLDRYAERQVHRCRIAA